MLVYVTAPHFTAGILVENEKVVEAAPILKWTKGRHITDVLNYFDMKEWHYEIGGTNDLSLDG